MKELITLVSKAIDSGNIWIVLIVVVMIIILFMIFSSDRRHKAELGIKATEIKNQNAHMNKLIDNSNPKHLRALEKALDSVRITLASATTTIDKMQEENQRQYGNISHKIHSIEKIVLESTSDVKNLIKEIDTLNKRGEKN